MRRNSSGLIGICWRPASTANGAPDLFWIILRLFPADNAISKGFKVAICEQLTDAKETKGMVERDVVQVVTKGTVLDNLLNGGEAINFGTVMY